MLRRGIQRSCRVSTQLPVYSRATSQLNRTFSAPGAGLMDDIVEQRARAAKRELAILAEAFHKNEFNQTESFQKEAEVLETLADLIKRYDTDDSGLLDRDEIMAALQDLELPVGEVELDSIFTNLTGDSAGAVKLTEWLDNLPRGTRIKICEKMTNDETAHRRVQFTVPGTSAKIMYTHTDEAPALATYSFLPIIRAYSGSSNISFENPDISVAGRILAAFPDYIRPEQFIRDELSLLGELAKTPVANIIKLPNISAALPQLTGAIAELQSQGFAVPDYPMEPKTAAEKQIQARYAKVIGSAVNPVLREGNSDRRVAGPVKEYAQKNPHKLGPWSSDSKTHVAHMTEGDFFGSEKSVIIGDATSVRIVLVTGADKTQVLKNEVKLQSGEVLDATRMSVKKLREYLADQVADAKEKDVLLSLHLKATMMKVSDPIIFGHAVTTFYKEVFEKHAEVFDSVGVNPNNGISDVYAKIGVLPEPKQKEIEADIMEVYNNRPRIAMVDSDKGITNLHAPNDVIIDASVPPVIRDSGMMWNWSNELEDTKMLIPDRSYAPMYQAIVEDCQKNGKLDVATMGNVPNVGLMAQKAQEYGSHDKTFEIPETGVVRVVDNNTNLCIFEHSVEKGDIWRACQTKDSPIQDWINLAVSRARATGDPAVFWLDADRAHDSNLLKKIDMYLPSAMEGSEGVEVKIMKPADAMKFTLERCRKGLNTISCTGNVLRDYLTDLFPIIELGTSAKMLSIVPLLAGGGLFETGAGGSAPKHVQQLVKENHLRWDSLGEFLALAVSIEDLAIKTNNERAKILADCLNEGVSELLNQNKSPKRKCGQLDNRGSHFYVALFWAEALAKRPEFADEFSQLAKDLRANEETIVNELNAVQGKPVDLGGYFHPDPIKCANVMRPSSLFNNLIDSFGAKGMSK